MDIFKHTAKKNKKVMRADQILPEVYGTTLNHAHVEVYSIQHYVIKFISDLWQVGGLLRFPHTGKIDHHDIYSWNIVEGGV